MMRRLYHFIGSIYFTLIIVPLAAVFVIIGTVLESYSDSHGYAAHFTYSNPLFSGLLSLFFANILISALRRWPFQPRHIPFLTTHLGLLMVIAGVMIKNSAGTQGAMIIWEGSSSSELLSSNEDAIVIQDRLGHIVTLPPRVGLSQNSVQVTAITPHVEETPAAWIVDNQLHIRGLPPMTISKQTEDAPLPTLGSVRLHSSSADPWQLYGCVASDVDGVINKLWKQNCRLTMRERATHVVLYDGPALEATGAHILRTDKGFALDWNYPPYHIRYELEEGEQPQDMLTPFIGRSPVDITIDRPPALGFVKTEEDLVIAAINQAGAISLTTPETWISYDNGFGGTCSQLSIPFEAKPRTVPASKQVLYDTLNRIDDPANLSPPLQFLWGETEAFAEMLISFLNHWDRCYDWFYPIAAPVVEDFPALPWSGEPYKACYWSVQIMEPIIEGLRRGEELFSLLKKAHWPLIEQLSIKHPVATDQVENALTMLCQQVFQIAPHLPEPPPYHPSMNMRLYSAYLRAYGIHLSAITPPAALPPLKQTPTIESPLIMQQRPAPPHMKWEENRPMVTLQHGGEWIHLVYDPSGKKLPLPDRNAKLLFRYQPKPIAIPHKVHVHEASQVQYANSSQTHSYRCVAFIDDEEIALSMNQVHETWDGYRFYLAAISPEAGGEVHQVRIVVNHDPAKYWVTYPGCCILVLGIGMFCMRIRIF